jgi:hypothetical protein
LLAEATEHNKEATARLQKDIADAERIRSAALAEAERIRVEAIANSEERIAAAKKQAAAINERTQQEFSWRKQQLKRETDLLGQRKQAVLNQLASLSALAEQTAQTFPDLEELEGFEAEHGDTTLLRPPNLPPSLPGASDRSEDDDSDDDTVIEGSASAGPKPEAKDNSQELDTETTMVQPAVRDDRPAGSASSAPASATSAPAASGSSPAASATSPGTSQEAAGSASSPSRPEGESTLVRESERSGQSGQPARNGSEPSNGTGPQGGAQQGGQQGRPQGGYQGGQRGPQQGGPQQGGPQGGQQGGDHTVLAPPPARPAGTEHLPPQPYPGTSAYPEQTGGSGQAPQPYRG